MIKLTPRQQQIAGLLMEPNKTIAARLDIAPNTVKIHIANAFKRTGARSRVELALLMRDREEKS